jgi:hypothetical protein
MVGYVTHALDRTVIQPVKLSCVRLRSSLVVASLQYRYSSQTSNSIVLSQEDRAPKVKTGHDFLGVKRHPCPLSAFIPLQHGTQHGGLAGSQACLTASYPSQPQLLSNCPSPILNPSCTGTQACLRPFSREKPYFRQISDSMCVLTSQSSLSIPRLPFRISFLPYPALLASCHMLGPPGETLHLCRSKVNIKQIPKSEPHMHVAMLCSPQALDPTNSLTTLTQDTVEIRERGSSCQTEYLSPPAECSHPRHLEPSFPLLCAGTSIPRPWPLGVWLSPSDEY